MGLVNILVEQCRRPSGTLGKLMIKVMDFADVGFTSWVLNQTKPEAKNILDIGCGAGKTIYKLAKRYSKSNMFGIDYSQEAVKTAIVKNKKFVESGRVVIKEANVLEMPFTNDMFDYIFAIRTHYFWNDLELSITNVLNKLKTGGEFVILSEKYKIEYHMKEYNTNELLINLLKAIGFSNVELVEKQNNIYVIAQK